MLKQVVSTMAQTLNNSRDQLNLPQVEAGPGTLGSVLNAIFFILGSLSVIFIVVGGIQYVISAGNADQTRKAKDTVLYAIVGLIISLLAVTIVSFVTGRFT